MLYFLTVLLPPLPVWVFGILLFLTGGFAGATNPMGVAMGQHLAPGNASVISGILMGLAWALGSLSMWVAGTLAARPGMGVVTTLAITGTTVLAAFVLSLLLRPDSPARQEIAAGDDGPP